jgi:hypothetical protein
MPGIRTLSVLLCAACLVAGAAACAGDESGIPREQGEELLRDLDQLEQLVRSGSCDEAENLALAFAQQVESLPDEVAEEQRRALLRASENLIELTREQCQEQPADETVETTTTEPTITTTEPTTQTTTTTTEPPKEDKDRGSDGRGGGSGGPGGGRGNSGPGGGNQPSPGGGQPGGGNQPPGPGAPPGDGNQGPGSGGIGAGGSGR